MNIKALLRRVLRFGLAENVALTVGSSKEVLTVLLLARNSRKKEGRKRGEEGGREGGREVERMILCDGGRRGLECP